MTRAATRRSGSAGAADRAPILEPDPDQIANARSLFELYATGRYSDDTLALEAARRGYRSSRTGRPLTAAGMADLLRNPIYNGYLVRFRGFADEERVEAPWRSGPDGDPPVSDDLWERVQAIRSERATVGARPTHERIYVPHLFCHGCGAALYGHASTGRRRMTHPAPACARWTEAAGGRTSFRAEIYEWQVAALLATAKVDDAAKERIVAALSDAPAPIDSRRVGRLEQELRTIALDNAFGRIGDADYLRRKTDLTTEIEAARRPQRSAEAIDPARAFAYLDDLRSLWEIDLPEQPRHQHVRREYELRRAEATTAAFERLEVLGPVIVEVKLSEDLLAGRTLALSLKPRRAELRGEQAEVMRQLLDGRRSRLVRVDTPEARKKRRQRDPRGTLRCIGRGERSASATRRIHGCWRSGAGAKGRLTSSSPPEPGQWPSEADGPSSTTWRLRGPRWGRRRRRSSCGSSPRVCRNQRARANRRSSPPPCEDPTRFVLSRETGVLGQVDGASGRP